MSLSRKIMFEVARRQLRGAKQHPRPTEPNAIEITTKGREGLQLRKMFCAQNRDMNQALQSFWRQQIERYS